MAVGWFAATAVGVVLASQAVALVGDNDGPPTLRLAADTVPTSSTSTTTIPDETTTTSTSLPPIQSTTTTATTEPESSTTTSGPSTTTTAPAGTTTTTAASTTTTAVALTDESTFTLQGGIAVVACLGDTPTLIAAVPAPGFAVEVDGTSELDVEFESEDHKSELEVECAAGQIDVRIKEQSS